MWLPSGFRGRVRTVGGVSTHRPEGCREGPAPGTPSENRRRGCWAEGVVCPRGAQPLPSHAPQGDGGGLGSDCPGLTPIYLRLCCRLLPSSKPPGTGRRSSSPPCGWPPGHAGRGRGGEWRWVWEGTWQIPACKERTLPTHSSAPASKILPKCLNQSYSH